jgi:hypothetical protein
VYDGGMEGYMTLQELAAKLGLAGAGSLRSQIARGMLAAEKIGTGQHGIWVVTDAEAERYARENHGRVGVASPAHPLYGKRGGGGRRKRESPSDT